MESEPYAEGKVPTTTGLTFLTPITNEDNASTEEATNNLIEMIPLLRFFSQIILGYSKLITENHHTLPICNICLSVGVGTKEMKLR